MSLVITGMAPYHTLNNAAPVAKIFSDAGLKWITLFISAAAIIVLIYNITITLTKKPIIAYQNYKQTRV